MERGLAVGTGDACAIDEVAKGRREMTYGMEQEQIALGASAHTMVTGAHGRQHCSVCDALKPADLARPCPGKFRMISCPMTRTRPDVTSVDSLKYCSDLDWFFGCAEALCGFRSALGAQIRRLKSGDSSGHNNVTPRDVPESVRVRLQLVFARLKALGLQHQVAIQRYYEGRSVPETRVAAAHKAFYA